MVEIMAISAELIFIREGNLPIVFKVAGVTAVDVFRGFCWTDVASAAKIVVEKTITRKKNAYDKTLDVFMMVLLLN